MASFVPESLLVAIPSQLCSLGFDLKVSEQLFYIVPLECYCSKYMLMPAVAFHLETIWFDMQIKWLVLYEMEHWAEMF